MFYWFAYGIIIILSKIFCPCRFTGQENLPKGSFILASNHISNLDPLILGLSCARKFGYIAKDSLFKNKLFSVVLHLVGTFPIKRDSSDVGAIKEALKRLERGTPIIMFPEGTRGGYARTQKVHSGIALIAIKSGVPVIPAYIQGSDQVLPKGTIWPRRRLVHVTIGSPVKLSADQSYPEMAEHIMKEILRFSPAPEDCKLKCDKK
ncbi:MAG: lysophospholipid acyltransferase family protein [bacterium]|nr:lysophospholipid acyltransferase family protein [bacterium]